MKENYAVKPAELEVFNHGNCTDIIIRKNITEVQDDESGAKWECEERQMRVDQILSFSEVKSSVSRYWSLAGGETPLNDVKEVKLKDLSDACHTAIVSGFDVKLADGEYHHFSLTVEDQLNINSLYGMIAAGAEQVPYHADGEPCRYFTAEEFTAIVQAATAHKTYHESYYNSLKSYVDSKRTEAGIFAIEYGTEIPAQYQSDVMKALIG